MRPCVVSYRNSTSNHNIRRTTTWTCVLYLIEILHQTTTEAEEQIRMMCCILSKFYIKPQLEDAPSYVSRVVSYRNSTSNHNGGSRYSDWLEVVSYRNSTSNHNGGATTGAPQGVVSYRNSTSNHNLRAISITAPGCCILSKFYIKPQLNLCFFIRE